ncbi:glycosyltransferase family 39 protein [Paenibacillus chitinolyticus]|uniref:ArnT family glycosyltransferase n=1 Tax=Paenibacillus chitinolyticus TaxID=79263 RepID=UPI002DB5A8F5|nr:glycosyltransferase family 39 protein [Paenibacillus chitinolyticus]MEC0248246.1 glycosyltransferase family 39 protein [Paenibacillus chitinolyticus]
MNRKKRVWAALVVIFLLAAYVRIDFLRSVDHEMPHDSLNYDKMVRQLLETGVYAYNGETPNALVTPGYPLFLAAVYEIADYKEHDPLPWVRYIQALLSLAALGLVYRIARRFSGELTALIALLIAAVYPPFVWANGAILTEVLAIFLLMGYLLAQIRVFETPSYGRAAAAGIWLGLTVLVRPEFLPLIAVAFAFQWLRDKEARNRTIRLFACTAAAVVLLLAPWWIRNAVTLHQWVATATQENPFRAGTYPYNTFNDESLVDPAGKTEKELAIARLKAGFTTQPGLFIKWYTIGKMQYVYQSVYRGGGHQPYYPVIPFDANLLHRALVLSGAIAVLAALRRWRETVTLLALTVIVMSLIRLGFVADYRYNVTMMPLIIILDCVLGWRAIMWWKGRWTQKTAVSNPIK